MKTDEAKISYRKYSRGSAIEGNWVFGIIQRDCFLLPVKLVPCDTITRNQGPHIASDRWAYSCLHLVGNRHKLYTTVSILWILIQEPTHTTRNVCNATYGDRFHGSDTCGIISMGTLRNSCFAICIWLDAIILRRYMCNSQIGNLCEAHNHILRSLTHYWEPYTIWSRYCDNCSIP